jgi:hypothetical protein
MRSSKATTEVRLAKGYFWREELSMRKPGKSTYFERSPATRREIIHDNLFS